VTGEDAVGLDETLGAHVLEGSLLGNDEGNLSKLSREEETGRGGEGVTGGAEIDVAKEGEGLDVTVGVG
jgi:hypothetical protein